MVEVRGLPPFPFAAVRRGERKGWGTQIGGKVHNPKNLGCATRHLFILGWSDLGHSPKVRALPGSAHSYPGTWATRQNLTFPAVDWHSNDESWNGDCRAQEFDVPRSQNRARPGTPVHFGMVRPGPLAQGSCSPRCPNARHLGHPSSVAVRTATPAPGPPA